jgi:hypothetical protein
VLESARPASAQIGTTNGTTRTFRMPKALRMQGFRIAGARYVPRSDARIRQEYRLAA